MRIAKWKTPLIVAVLAFCIDQVAKWLIVNVMMLPPTTIPIGPFMNVTLGYNTGMSFGLLGEALQDRPWVLGLLGLVIASGILWWALRTSDRIEAGALGAVAGGACGNIVDRWRIGAVVDFLDLYYDQWHWPTFNLADVAIFAGVVTLLVRSLRPRSEQFSASDENDTVRRNGA